MTTGSFVLLFLLILAFVLLCLAALRIGTARLHFGWAALALGVLIYIIKTVIV